MQIIRCKKCNSEIAIEDGKPYDIDCDCGERIMGQAAEATA